MNKIELTDFIKMSAMKEGFDLTGITSSQMPLYTDYLHNWIEAGYAAGMTWMSSKIEQKMNIKKIMNECASVIVVGENYYRAKDDRSYGQIARYAVSEDYHKRIKKKLINLCQSIQSVVEGIKYKVYVDTGPVMEKLWAMKAGLGWIGKHSIIVNSSIGSWFCIGVILINKELIHDKPAENLCGECTRCIDACPTAAISTPYVLNAGRCISYLTQYGIDIPSQLHPVFNGYFFGCDICQEVCPWAKHARVCSLPGKSLPLTYSKEELMELLSLSVHEFVKSYAEFPLIKYKLKGLSRNIAHILENTHDISKEAANELDVSY